ncbi:MAG: hypothetical protein H6856_07935 [Rhodospirillales bacterium]|nr:hypothetical protein [Rhodospirillales bacterium]
MAQNSFHVDHKKLRAELDALPDSELYARYEAANEALHGSESMDIGTIQDSAMLEGMFVEDQAVLKVAGELLMQRGLINQFGLRIEKSAGEPPTGPEL